MSGEMITEFQHEKITLVRTLLNECKKNYTSITTYKILEDFILSIPQIKNIISIFCSENNPTKGFDEIRKFLNERWIRISNTSICYTLNNNYIINWICSNLAEIVDPENKNSLLMFTLSQEDVIGNQLNELEFGQFIVSDDRKSFICITDLLSIGKERIQHSEKDIFIFYDAITKKTKKLSADEFERFTTLCIEAKEIKNLPTTKSDTKIKLFNLREGLRKGDKFHGGTEKVSGKEGDVYIAEFFDWYNKLPAIYKNLINNLSDAERKHTLGEILSFVRRDNNNNGKNLGINYCEAILGSYLDEIIVNINNNQTVIEGRDQSVLAKLDEFVQKGCQRAESLRVIEANTTFGIPPDINQVMQQKLGFSSQGRYKNPELLMIYFVTFIVAEINRINEKKKDNVELKKDKTKPYLNLLLAIAWHVNSFSNMALEEQKLILTEIYRRLDEITKLRANSLDRKRPTSYSNWLQFLENNKFLLGLCNIATNKNPKLVFPALKVFLATNPVSDQRLLMSEQLAAYRTTKVQTTKPPQQPKQNIFGKSVSVKESSKTFNNNKENRQNFTAPKQPLYPSIVHGKLNLLPNSKQVEPPSTEKSLYPQISVKECSQQSVQQQPYSDYPNSTFFGNRNSNNPPPYNPELLSQDVSELPHTLFKTLDNPELYWGASAPPSIEVPIPPLNFLDTSKPSDVERLSYNKFVNSTIQFFSRNKKEIAETILVVTAAAAATLVFP